MAVYDNLDLHFHDDKDYVLLFILYFLYIPYTDYTGLKHIL